MADRSAIISALERNDHRATEPRLAVARLIADQPGHFTAADVVRDLDLRDVLETDGQLAVTHGVLPGTGWGAGGARGELTTSQWPWVSK